MQFDTQKYLQSFKTYGSVRLMSPTIGPMGVQIGHIQIYPRYIQDIQDKYKIPSGRRPGPAQARPKPGAAHGLAAWYRFAEIRYRFAEIS